LGKITAAISSANEACKLAPNQWRAYICLAQAQMGTGIDLNLLAQAERPSRESFTAAGQAAATALRLAPYQPDAHFTAGQVSYALRRWKAARAHYKRALALDPAHSGALNELGRISLRRGGHQRAASHFIQAARSAPGVSAYGRNVKVPIANVLVLNMSAMYAASVALLILLVTPVPPKAAVLGYALVITLVARTGTVQLWRMPPQMRRLFWTRRVGLAMGPVYGAVLFEVIIAAVTPARVLFPVILATTALLVASLFVARAGLRRWVDKAGRM
jgi:tetratricopeptide (TPR) repeat protein